MPEIVDIQHDQQMRDFLDAEFLRPRRNDQARIEKDEIEKATRGTTGAWRIQASGLRAAQTHGTTGKTGRSSKVEHNKKQSCHQQSRTMPLWGFPTNHRVPFPLSVKTSAQNMSGFWRWLQWSPPQKQIVYGRQRGPHDGALGWQI